MYTATFGWFLLVTILWRVEGKDLQYFSSSDGDLVFGAESNIQDFVTVANDPKANLGDSFTVCSSLFVQYAVTASSFIEILKKDGSHWILLTLSHPYRDLETMTEGMRLFYSNPITGEKELEVFRDTNIPIVPHSWYHICMGLDTVSGLLRIVLNGVLVVNEEKDYFRNTKSWKPRSIVNKILLFKAHKNGFWSQQKSAFSNLNIFGFMMTVEDMEKRTSGGNTCAFPGDYLRYKQEKSAAMQHSHEL